MLLGRIGPAAQSAVPALTESIGDEDAEVRREVLYSLGSIIADKGPADPRIVAALDDPELRMRATAAYALGRVGPAAKAAVPKLSDHLESDDPLVRIVRAWALAHIAPQDAQLVSKIVPVLIHGTKSETFTVRRGARMRWDDWARPPARPWLRSKRSKVIQTSPCVPRRLRPSQKSAAMPKPPRARPAASCRGRKNRPTITPFDSRRGRTRYT